MEHSHDWLLATPNLTYRDVNGNWFTMSVYQCECGAGGFTKTPKDMFESGFEIVGINEYHG